ncbi:MULTISPECIES: YitT family protein [unclassified Sporolactobacillus]|uniref:YitT family protein n=1 Tax=unclassified Sporolactobacillus TaxID=2628533 RepID=UPI002367FBCF|nr:YitT family protein [Sporolactobacillus sp. CQH2019]MDD9147299.1 YitT family protein [Sporolactobacillus sp. CQH2019]
MAVYHEIKVLAIVTIGAFLNAASLNLFLIPAKVLSGGVTGIAQLISALLQPTAVHISTGLLLLLLNIPVAWVGWIKVGHRFTLYSIVSVALTTFFMALIPLYPLTGDILLNAVFGGVVQATGVGLTLKFGASTGGMDIIAMILSRAKDRPIGVYMFALNALIILSAGFFFGWRRALYTLLQLYVSSRVVDAIHTRYVKLTAWIVTNKGKEVQKAIYSALERGITRIPAKGGFTNQDKEVLMIVITRYELYDLKRVVRFADPLAFTNVVETTAVFGLFRKDK